MKSRCLDNPFVKKLTHVNIFRINVKIPTLDLSQKTEKRLSKSVQMHIQYELLISIYSKDRLTDKCQNTTTRMSTISFCILKKI